MTDQNNIQDELRDLNSSLPANSGEGPFSVPQGYFDGLAASVLAKVKGQSSAVAEELQALSPFLASLPKTTPYSLPQNYFDQNISALPFLFSEVESPLVAAIGKKMPYTVPGNYFETLPQRVLAEATRHKAKVVPLFARRWMRVAVAAVVGGIIFAGAYRYWYQPNAGQVATQQPANSSQNQTAKTETSVLQDIKNASTTELQEFIKELPFGQTAEPQKASHQVKRNDVDDLLKGVSKKDIENFLEQLPVADDELTSID